MSDANKISSFLTAEAGNISESLAVDLEELRKIPRPKCPIYDSEYYSTLQDVETPKALPSNAEEKTSEQPTRKKPEKIYHGCLKKSPSEILAMPRPRAPYQKRDLVKDFLSGINLPKTEESQLGK